MEEPPAARRRSESGSREGEGAVVEASVHMVLDCDHLLDEILFRLDKPAFLILASAVSRMWNTRAKSPAVLNELRTRLVSRPYPRPLGFYVGFFSDDPHDRNLFVPMLQHSPELTDVIDRASFGCGDEDEQAPNQDDADEDEDDEEDEDDADEDEDDADEYEDEDEDEEDAGAVPGKDSHVLDCRNGRILLNLKRRDDTPHAEHAVFRPLDKKPVLTSLPQLPDPESFVNNHVLRFLPDADADGECVVIALPFLSKGARFCVLQEGTWSINDCTGTEPFTPIKYCDDMVFVDNNLYVLAGNRYIVRFEFCPEAKAVSSFIIQLPPGVNLATKEMHSDYPVALSRGYDSGVYFIHVKDSHLTAWLYSINAGVWLMDAYIDLPDAFAPFKDQIVGPEDFYDDLSLYGAGDHADFVFLAAGEDDHIYYLNLRTKIVESVYERKQMDGAVLDICAFMMVRTVTTG